MNVIVNQIKEGKAVNLSCIMLFQDITEKETIEIMKLDFVAMTAHELRTPITSIRGYLSVVLDEGTQSLSQEHNQFLKRALGSSDELTILIDNLSAISNIEKGMLTSKLKPTKLSELIKKTIDTMQFSAQEKGLELSYSIVQDSDILVLCDPFCIQEVLNNLISNAIAYTPSGSVTVAITYDIHTKSVITSVKDTGPGIPTYSLPHLFEKFYRVTGILEQGSKGTGLGLYISKKIVEMHKGKIWVESQEGQGSTFAFSLPVAP